MKKYLFLFLTFFIFCANADVATTLINKAKDIKEENAKTNDKIIENVNQDVDDKKIENISKNDSSNVSNSPNVQNSSISQNTSDISEKVYTSIMFSEKHISDINKAIPFLLLNSKNKNLKNNTDINIIDNGKNFILSDNESNIYIDSILYTSKNNWSIWINNKKITNKDRDDNEDIIITSISPLKVSFYWMISSSKWEFVNISKQISPSRYEIENNKIKLHLTLSPNQTYVSLLDTIIEGKLKEEKSDDTYDVKSQNSNNVKNDINYADDIFF